MEKYAEIIKAMAECAGPDCGLTCPYKDKSAGAKSCRAVLLEDAIAALQNEMAGNETFAEAFNVTCGERDKLVEDNKTLNAEMDDLEAVTNTLRAERDGMRAERDAYANECKALTREVNILHERCQVQQNEINALLLKNSKQDAKTDRPSVGFDGSLAYWCGRADALAEVVSSIVGEASGHE